MRAKKLIPPARYIFGYSEGPHGVNRCPGRVCHALLALLAIGCLLLAAGPAPAQPAPPEPDPNQILAVVDRKVFTDRDLRPWVFDMRLTNPRTTSMDRQSLRRAALSQAIDDYVLFGWAEMQIQQMPPEIIDAQFRDTMARYAELVGPGNRLDDLLRDADIDPKEFRIWVRDQGRMGLYIRQAIIARTNLAGLDPLDEKIDKADRILLAHILISAPMDNDASRQRAYERALLVRRDIAATLDFAKAARLYSDDAGTATRGGEIGWFGPGEVQEDLWRAAIATDFGAVSFPVPGRNGYHLVRVIDFETPGQRLYLERVRRSEKQQLANLRKERTIRLAEGYELRELDVDAESPAERLLRRLEGYRDAPVPSKEPAPAAPSKY